ncbi:sporulation protein [Streptomyces sp. NPDC092369]|uniref:sporulation protein n=1 Tax=Streptomyces sp. NPDC092369 TaxID=3366015 RepID=UPI0038085F84
MGLKRLFGIGDPDEVIEVDTQILGPTYPGGEVRGEVLLRGGSRDTDIHYVSLRVRVRLTGYDGKEEEYALDSCSAEPGYFTLRAGAEQRLTFSEPLPWETPVSELGGRALGVVLSVKSELTLADGTATDVDVDLLHVSAPPLHESVLDAFAEEGYLCDSAYVVNSYVPDTEQQLGFHQAFVLTGHAPGQGRPQQLEVVFQNNAVGAMIHVRRAALDVRDWRRKPPARRFPAAHHEVGDADWRPRIRRVLDALVLLDEH